MAVQEKDVKKQTNGHHVGIVAVDVKLNIEVLKATTPKNKQNNKTTANYVDF